MTVLITIRSTDAEVNRAMSYFIAAARDRDEQRWRRPRSLWRRLLDAFAVDRPLWDAGGGNEWNHMPGMAFRYETGDFNHDGKEFVPLDAKLERSVQLQ